jgi:uncharacterized protein YkwD
VPGEQSEWHSPPIPGGVMSILCAWFALAGLVLLGDDPKPKPDPKLGLSKEEKEFVELTNKVRAKEELPALEPHAWLFKAARDHSATMAKKGELEHKFDGKTVGDRAEAVGYEWTGIGENIAESESDTPPGIMKIWMGSEGHRANILNKKFVHLGVGVVKNDKGETYYTLVFGTPAKK